MTDYEFDAAPVVLPADARERLGYAVASREPLIIERSGSAGGVDVEVTVESPVAVYEAEDGADRGTAAAPTLGAVSTPKASVSDQSFNPLVQLPPGALLTSRAGGRYLRRAGFGRLTDREQPRWERGPTLVTSTEGRCLGRVTALESYAGIVGRDSPSVAFVHLARVDAESVVIATAVHGHEVEATERPFVGPDTGYLSRGTLDGAVDRFGSGTVALAYDGEGGESSE